MSCPSESQLILFLEDDANGELSPEVLAHLEHCAACHRRLEQVTDSQTLRVIFEHHARVEARQHESDATQSETATKSDVHAAEQTREKYKRLLEQAHQDAEAEHDRFGKLLSESWSDSSPGLYGHPKQFGRFRLKRFLGKGGFGVVYLARDQLLERYVALKLPLAPTFSDPSVRRRFLHEGKAAGQLHHPNIVAIYEAGEIDDICYLSSAYCSGPTLANWLEHQDKPVASCEAARLTLALADAVQHAHERNILHRDIKPANVLLEPTLISQPTGHRYALPYIPKLSDFGLAKSVETPSSNMTSAGVIVGTARYLSPEQAAGRLEDVGPPSDVYSLGTVLYELLTRQPAIDGDNNAVTLTKVISAEPRRPRSIVPGTPRDLESICLKCLEKSPQDRYATADELAHDLRRFLAGESTLARPQSITARIAKWSRRNPAWAALAATILIFLAALGALGWWSNVALTASLERTQTLLYAAEVRLAAESLQRFNTRRSRELLTRHIPAAGMPDRRDFVWHYLWQAIHSEQQALMTEPREAVWCVAVSPSSDMIAAGDATGRIWMWDLQNGTSPVQFRAHDDTVRSIEFSPDAKTLLTTSDDGTVRLWDVRRTSQRFELKQHVGIVYRARFTRDGRFFATCGADGLVKLWLANSGMLRSEFQGHTDRVYDLAFSEHGHRLVTTGKDCRAIVWDTASAKPIAELTDAAGQWGRFECVDMSPNGRLIAVGTNHGHVIVWDADLRSQVALYSNHTSNVLRVRFSEDGKSLASASKDTTVQVRDVMTGDNLRVLQGHDQPVYDVQFESDGAHLVSSGKDGAVRVWDVATSLYEQATLQRTPVHAAEISRQRVAITVPGPFVVVHDMQHRSKHVLNVDNHRWRVDCRFSGDNRFLAVSGKAFGHTKEIDKVMAGPSVVTMEDVDGDGDDDLVSSLPTSRQLVWQECTPDNQFLQPRLMLAEGESRVSASRVTTVMKDGHKSRLRVRISRNQVRAFRIHDPPKDSEPIVFLSDMPRPSCIAGADIDNDGDDDLIVATEGDTTLAWWENGGDFKFDRKHVIAQDIRDVIHVIAKRLDDQSMSIVAIADDGHSVVTFRAAPTEIHSSWRTIKQPVGAMVSLLDLADVDGDGATDLVMASAERIQADCGWMESAGPRRVTLSELKDGSWLAKPPANVLMYDLRQEPPQLVFALNAMSNDTYDVALSADGSLLATVSIGDVIRLWDSTTGDLVRTFPRVAATNDISDIAFANHERLLVFAAGDIAYVWNLQADESEPRRLVGHSNTINDLDVSPNGRFVATTSHDHTVRIWDLETTQHLQTLVGHRQRPCRVCFNPNGRLLASAGESGEVVVWHLETGQELLGLSNFNSSMVAAVAFLDNDSLFVVGESSDDTGRIETRTGLWKSHPGRRGASSETD